MSVEAQIKEYITSHPEAKCSDIEALHSAILRVMPGCKLWFLDGKDEKNKIAVSAESPVSGTLTELHFYTLFF